MSSYGMILSNSPADLNNDITISAGFRRSFNNTADINLATAITKRLDATWAAGNNCGGMQAGTTKAANKTYHAHAITNGTTVDVIFSLSPTAPVLPSGYTARKRLFAVMTDASGNIRRFLQTGDHCQWLDALYEGAYTITPYASSFTLTVPAGIKVLADLSFQVWAHTGYTYFSVCDQDLGDANQEDVILSCGTSSTTLRAPVWTDTAGRVNMVAGQNCTLNLFNRGWMDNRDG